MENFTINKKYFIVILDQKGTTVICKTTVELERIEQDKVYFQYNNCEVIGTMFGNVIVGVLLHYHMYKFCIFLNEVPKEFKNNKFVIDETIFINHTAYKCINRFSYDGILYGVFMEKFGNPFVTKIYKENDEEYILNGSVKIYPF